jgi:DNA modification methylase
MPKGTSQRSAAAPVMAACIIKRPLGDLTPSPRNARTHSKAQIAKIAESILRFGFTNPVLVDEKAVVLAGHGRLAAARLIGLSEAPTICLSHLSAAQKRAYVLADNVLAEKAGWDRDLLALEIGELVGLLEVEGLDISLTGFDPGEVDALLEDFSEDQDLDDRLPEVGPAVAESGDLWRLGRHRLVCGDARDGETLERLMGGELAVMVFIDPPYNVPVAGHVQGRGGVKHREFAHASGEMSSEEFTRFLEESLRACASQARNGSISFVCCDWRHVVEFVAAGSRVYDELKNLCVWVKSNAGQGSFYRSQHELVLVFKKGDAPHINTFGLGQGGRSRSNVWHYAGANAFKAGGLDELRMHPTVKPVALVADAMRDCSKRGDIVLDTFMGSGTTIMAAEKLGRRGFGVEIDPLYVDVSLRRWQAQTKADAILDSTGETYEEVARRRAAERARPAADEAASPEPATQPQPDSGEDWVGRCGDPL